MTRQNSRWLLVLTSLLLIVGFTVGPAAAQAPKEIVFMDSQSGANFQQWFQTIALPAAESALGIKIKYVVGNDAEIFEKMKAWKPGEGDFGVFFPKSAAKLISEGKIPLETFTPDKVPNMAKIDPTLQVSTDGVPVNNKALAYWYSTYALVYNSARVPNPPKSWKEFYSRLSEWKGHIGFIRPDAKSSAGWRQPFVFLAAFYDFPKPFDSTNADFQAAWSKLKEVYAASTLPLAAEPPNMFENFNADDTWITLYAMDYSLWSARQGTMPPTTKAAFLQEGTDAGGQAYIVVPANISDDMKATAFRLVNYLLSEDQQVRLVSTMFQYPSTQVIDKVPGIVWEQIPKPEAAHAAQIPASRVSSEAIEWVKQHGAELIPK
jgi:putative spermidine/putrescine transport system substrate-binding protein